MESSAAENWKVGRALSGDATAEMMREAVKQVLGSSAYREQGAAISTQLAGVDGASNGADEIELLLSKHLRKAS